MITLLSLYFAYEGKKGGIAKYKLKRAMQLTAFLSKILGRIHLVT